MSKRVARRLGSAIVCASILAGCGTGGHASTDPAVRALEREARPIGHGARFHEPARGDIVGACRRSLGRRDAAHVEVFAANRVVLIPAGIGVRGPTRQVAGRIVSARCYGALVTLDPTGVLLLRPGRRLTLADVFRSWGQPLSTTRLGPFSGDHGARVRVFVDGRPVNADPRAVLLTRHAEIVLEIGPVVPPHHQYTFPSGE